MPDNGSGTYSRTNGDHTGTTVWTQDKDGSIKITSARHDVHDQDLATALTNRVCKDGQSTMSGNLKMGGNDLTGIGNINGVSGADVTFDDGIAVTGSQTVGGTVVATGKITGGGGLQSNLGLSVYGGDALIDANLEVTGTITNALMPTSGTFSPTFTTTGSGSFTMGVQDGQYTKIGNMVVCNIYAEGTGVSPTGYLKISLPYASGSIAGAGSVATFSGIDAEQGLIFESTANQSYGILKKLGDDGFANFVDCGADIPGTATLTITIVYFTA